MTTKCCNKCGEEKLFSEYHKDKTKKDGLFTRCKSCVNSYNREYMFARRKSDPEFFKKSAKESKKYCAERRAKDPEYVEQQRSKKLFQKYGITLEEKVKKLEAQKYQCVTCFRVLPTHSEAAVDHCHSTGVIRDLLCSQCNIAIGMIKDDPTVAENLASYLRKWGK